MTFNKLIATSKNIFLKIFLIIIGLSLGIAGLSGIFTGRDPYVAKVANHPILIHEFARAKEIEIERIKSILGEAPSDEILKSFNVDKIVLARLVDKKLFDLEVESLGLEISDKLVSQHIKNTAVFSDDNGKFDKNLFDRILSANGLTETKYFALVKKEIAENYLHEIITDHVIQNPLIEKQMVKYVSEEAKFNLVIVNNLPKTYPTEDKEIEDYLKKNEKDFSTKEFRRIKYFSLSYDNVSNDYSSSEEEMKNFYDDNIDSYSSPLTRDIYNLVFESEKTAIEARQLLSKSADFAKDGIKLSGQKTLQEVELKSVTIQSFDKELSQEIFKLKENEISQPLKSDFGYHLIKIAKEYPEHSKAFEEVKSDIKKRLLWERKEKDFSELMQNIEDELASGAAIEEMATKYHLKLQITNFVSKEGFYVNGTEFIKPDLDNFLEVAFSAPLGKDSSLISSKNGTIYFATRCDENIPSKLKDLKEVRNEILDRINLKKSDEDSAKSINMIYEEIKDGTNLSAEQIKGKYKERGFKAQVSEDFSTSRFPGKNSEIPEDILNTIFKLNAGQISKPIKIDAKKYALIKINSFKFPEKIPANLEQDLRKQIRESFSQAIREEMIDHLYKKYTVQMNENFLRNNLQ